MIIKYTGDKPVKAIHMGGKLYEFAKTCEVTNKKVVDWLLNPDKHGLFVEENLNIDTVSKQLEESNVQETQTETKILKKRGRRRK